MFGLGFPELIVIFVLALLIFGPKKLPDLGKSVGRAMAEFKKAQKEFHESVQTEMNEVEKTVNLKELKELGSVDLNAYKDADKEKGAAIKPEEAVEQKQEEAKREGNKTDG